MVKRTIASRHVYYFGLFVHLLVFALVTVALNLAVANSTELEGIFFLVVLFALVTLKLFRFLRRDVIVDILEEKYIHLKSIFLNETVLISEVKDLRSRTFTKRGYKMIILGRVFEFHSDPVDVKYLNDLLHKSGNRQSGAS